MDTAIKHPVSDWVKPSFVILTSRHAQGSASKCPDVKKNTNDSLSRSVALYLCPCCNSGRQMVKVSTCCDCVVVSALSSGQR